MCQRHRLTVPLARDIPYLSGSIRVWSQSHLAYFSGGGLLEERKLTSQFPSVTVKVSVQCILKITSDICT